MANMYTCTHKDIVGQRCGRVFREKTLYVGHLLKEHNVVVKEDKPTLVSCPFIDEYDHKCMQTYQSTTSRNKHLLLIHGAKPDKSACGFRVLDPDSDEYRTDLAKRLKSQQSAKSKSKTSPATTKRETTESTTDIGNKKKFKTGNCADTDRLKARAKILSDNIKKTTVTEVEKAVATITVPVATTTGTINFLPTPFPTYNQYLNTCNKPVGEILLQNDFSPGICKPSPQTATKVAEQLFLHLKRLTIPVTEPGK